MSVERVGPIHMHLGADGEPFVMLVFKVEAKPRIYCNDGHERIFTTLHEEWLDLLHRALTAGRGEDP